MNTGGLPLPGQDSSRTIVPERFWFRDGMIALPEYLPSSGIFYAASEVDLPAATVSRLDVLSSGTYEVFVDGKSVLLHDARYAAAPTRDSSSLSMPAGHHRILLKFSQDAAPLSVALHSQFEVSPQKKIALPTSSGTIHASAGSVFPGRFCRDGNPASRGCDARQRLWQVSPCSALFGG